MKNRLKYLFIITIILSTINVITSCSNTVQGMKQDIREDTNSDYDTPS